VGINYPGTPPGTGFDDFSVPSEPEGTPLSEAGTSNRNHPELHEDINSAVEALQHWAALRSHDHSGADDIRHGPKLPQASTHENADTDSGPTAIHHTIGTGPGQVAAGNHTHAAPTLPQAPYVICTSTTRPPNPWVGMQIYETDLKCVRIWDSFGTDDPVTGLNAQDTFPTTFTDAYGRHALDPASWEQWYEDDPADRDHGAMGVVAPGVLTWTDQGTDNNRCIARRIATADKQTITDDQVLTWKGGDIVIEPQGIDSLWASNDGLLRMSADRQNYWRVKVGSGHVKVTYTTTGPGGEQDLGLLTWIDTRDPDLEWRFELVGRGLTIYRNGQSLGTVKDTKSLTAMGANFRGWGIGMEADDGLLAQITPGSIQWVRIQDYIYYTSVNHWTILPVARVPIVRLRQNSRQQLQTAGSMLVWDQELEDNFGYFNPAANTNIVIADPGMYHIDAAIQWDLSVVPDIAAIILVINGLETTTRSHWFQRGGTSYNPGFSQTLSFSGMLRLKTNDVLSVKVKYTVAASLLGQIFSYVDGPGRVTSRIDLQYTAV
jgi:hypothetical protein